MVFLLVSSGVLHVTVVSRWLSWELVDLRGLRGDSLSSPHGLIVKEASLASLYGARRIPNEQQGNQAGE